ncbi:hypothetical protein [Thermaurantiacus sp.]
MAAAVAALSFALPALATAAGPVSCLAASDSPGAGPSLGTFVLRDFGLAGLDPTTVTASAGSSRNFGHPIDPVGGKVLGSWPSTGQLQSSHFSRFADVRGRFPAPAGIVWTDDGLRLSDGGGPSDLRVSAIEGLGSPLVPALCVPR